MLHTQTIVKYKLKNIKHLIVREDSLEINNLYISFKISELFLFKCKKMIKRDSFI